MPCSTFIIINFSRMWRTNFQCRWRLLCELCAAAAVLCARTPIRRRSCSITVCSALCIPHQWEWENGRVLTLRRALLINTNSTRRHRRQYLLQISTFIYYTKYSTRLFYRYWISIHVRHLLSGDHDAICFVNEISCNEIWFEMCLPCLQCIYRSQLDAK